MIKITNDSDINLGGIFCNDKDLENSDKECVLISGFTEAQENVSNRTSHLKLLP